MTHIRIKLGVPGKPSKHVSLYDEVVVVGDDGAEIDISGLVRCHELVSRTGDPRMLRLELFCVGEIDGAFMTARSTK